MLAKSWIREKKKKLSEAGHMKENQDIQILSKELIQEVEETILRSMWMPDPWRNGVAALRSLRIPQIHAPPSKTIYLSHVLIYQFAAPYQKYFTNISTSQTRRTKCIS
jgi:hypothetical protein